MNVTLPITRFVNSYQFNNSRFDSALIEAIRADGGVKSYTSNVQAYTTEWTLDLDHNAAPFDQFFDFLNSSIGTSLDLQVDGRSDFDPNQRDYRYEIVNLWGAIYKSGDYTRIHKHLGSPVGMTGLSFVYYAQADDSNTAPLEFPTIEYSITPVTGQLVLFPGWLTHYVPEYQPVDGRERIVLAGNIAVGWKNSKDD